jgi:hypothetical protein
LRRKGHWGAAIAPGSQRAGEEAGGGDGGQQGKVRGYARQRMGRECGGWDDTDGG